MDFQQVSDLLYPFGNRSLIQSFSHPSNLQAAV